MSQEVLMSIVDLVARRLQNSGRVVEFNAPQQQQPRPQQKSPAPPSPVVLDDVNANGLLDTPKSSASSALRRSVSSASSSLRRSASSASSASSQLQVQESQFQDSESDDEKDAYCQYDTIKKSRRKLYRPSDKIIVNAPVMEKLDALFLAPVLSNLFARRKRKGSDEFKKNAEIKFNMLKALLKPTIRRLVRDSNLREEGLEQRFFWCAYDLTRKRRANHIQSWRKYSRPLDLIYGGQREYEATYGSAVPRIPLRAVAAHADLGDEQQQHAENGEAGRPPKKKSRLSKKKKKQLFAQADPADAQVDPADAQVDPADTDPFDPNFCEELEHITYKCSKCGAKVDWNSYFKDSEKPREAICDKCRLHACIGCKEKFPHKDMFPRSSNAWANDEATVSQQLRCGICWERHIRDQYIPRAQALAEAKDDGTKAKQKKPCKCGATTHATTRHRLCPLNIKYNSHTTPPTGKKKRSRKQKKPCKCGSTTHATPRHSCCLLNKKNRPSEQQLRAAARAMAMAGAAARRAAAAAAAAATDPGNFFQCLDTMDCPHFAGYFDPCATPYTGTQQTPTDPTNAAPTPADPTNAAPPTPTAPTNAAPTPTAPTTPPLPRRTYKIGENVCAKWKKGQWFLAHVTGYDRFNAEYSVYFVECGNTKVNLSAADLRETDSRYPTRGEMLDRDFFFDGAEDLPEGMWRVRRLLAVENMFECTRLTGTGLQNIEKFDIGYVIKQYMTGVDDMRGRVTSASVLATSRGAKRRRSE